MLKATKLKIELNTEKLEELLMKHMRNMIKKAVIPKWFITLVAIVIVLLFTQSFGIL